MKYIYSISQISKLSLTLYTFSITSSVAGFVKIEEYGLSFSSFSFSFYFLFNLFLFFYF